MPLPSRRMAAPAVWVTDYPQRVGNMAARGWHTFREVCNAPHDENMTSAATFKASNVLATGEMPKIFRPAAGQYAARELK